MCWTLPKRYINARVGHSIKCVYKDPQVGAQQPWQARISAIASAAAVSTTRDKDSSTTHDGSYRRATHTCSILIAEFYCSVQLHCPTLLICRAGAELTTVVGSSMIAAAAIIARWYDMHSKRTDMVHDVPGCWTCLIFSFAFFRFVPPNTDNREQRTEYYSIFCSSITRHAHNFDM